MSTLWRTLFWILASLCASVAGAAEVMPPAPAQYFNDYAHVTSPAVAADLNQKLESFEKQTSNQIVVAVFSKMQSESSLEDYPNRVAESWKVGQKKTNNGTVLFVFVQDHRVRIEVGYGLEGALPDALAKQIIENEITPHFRTNDYDGGLTAGVTAILQATQGEYKGNGTTAVGEASAVFSLNSNTIFWIFVVVFIIFSMWHNYRTTGTVFTRDGRRTYRGGFLGGGFGGGWGGGGGGGGFSGGGGGFGGGGASGSW